MRGGLAWMLTAPLALVSSQLAHKLAYLGAEGDDDKRAELLESTGHGYLAELTKPTALVATGFCLAALAVHCLWTRRGGPGARLRAAPFALVPVVAFVLQEHLERLLHHGQLGLAFVLEPPFLLGLVLQLPFAALAFATAWLLLRATEALARVLAGGRREVPLCGTASTPTPLAVELPRARVRARGYTGRGPPLVA